MSWNGLFKSQNHRFLSLSAVFYRLPNSIGTQWFSSSVSNNNSLSINSNNLLIRSCGYIRVASRRRSHYEAVRLSVIVDMFEMCIQITWTQIRRQTTLQCLSCKPKCLRIDQWYLEGTSQIEFNAYLDNLGPLLNIVLNQLLNELHSTAVYRSTNHTPLHVHVVFIITLRDTPKY